METVHQTKNEITEGVIWKQLLLFFFPILLGTFFQQLYNTIDSVIVGQFVGKEALASVGGSSAQIVALVVGFFTGLSSGAAVVIAQFVGARKEETANAGLHTAYAIAAAGGIALTFIGILTAPILLRLMNTPADTMDGSLTYLRIYFAGILFVLIYNMGSAVLRAAGDSKTPLYILIICCIINIILDTAFVLLFHMGVAGVAVATLTAQAVSAVLVTHVHADHIFGIDELRVFCRCAPLRLYTSQFWVDDIRKRFPYAFGQVIQKGGGVPKVETVPVAGAFTVDNVPIVPIPVIHGEALTYGYRFGNTAYVTDCNVIPDESYALLSGVEQIVIEGAWSDENTFHMSFVGAINAVERIGAKRAWFTHIYHKTKHAEIQRIIDEELKKRPALVEAGVRIEPGYDGLKITNIII